MLLTIWIGLSLNNPKSIFFNSSSMTPVTKAFRMPSEMALSDERLTLVNTAFGLVRKKEFSITSKKLSLIISSQYAGTASLLSVWRMSIAKSLCGSFVYKTSAFFRMAITPRTLVCMLKLKKCKYLSIVQSNYLKEKGPWSPPQAGQKTALLSRPLSDRSILAQNILYSSSIPSHRSADNNNKIITRYLCVPIRGMS